MLKSNILNSGSGKDRTHTYFFLFFFLNTIKNSGYFI